MSLLKANAVQLGQSLTASQNFTWYQPSTPDGTVRLGNGNSGSVTDLVTLTSAGNLGIGTSSPGSKLEVNGNQIINYSGQSQSLLTVGGGSTSAAMNFRGSTGSAYAWQISSNSFVGSALEFTRSTSVGGTTFSTPSMLLDSSGNLGLGVTPSAWATYAANIQTSSGAIASYSTTQLEVIQNAYYNGGWIYKASGYASGYLQQSGVHKWVIAPSGTAGNAISFTQAMTLDASGNLLVGTTSTTGYGNFANALQSATVSANSNARSFDSTYRVAASNNAAVDVWLCRDANGSTFGNNSITGHFYIYVVGASGADAYSAVYSLVTTGNGTSQATLTAVSSVTRGTSPVLSVAIANDGVNGAVKLRITYINNSGVVTGGYSSVVFKGLVVP